MALRLMRTPRAVDLELTSRCNLRCRYCYFMENPEVEYGDLPTEEWISFLDELGSLGVMEVTLAGGEPILRDDIRELIERIIRNRMRFSILSNGILIDDELAAFLAASGRCSSVQVSLDGSRPETHDAARGKGSFAGAVQGLRALVRHGVNATVRVTIHHHNVDDLENVARFLLEDLNLPSFSTNAAGYLGTCRRHADDILLTIADRQRAMELLLRLAEKYAGRIQANAGPLAEGRMWRKMETARAGTDPPFPDGGRLTACGCTFRKLVVRPDGTIVPCTMLPHMGLGRINQDRLADIWLHSTPLNELRRRRDIPLASFAFCAGCNYQSYCTGNCPALAYSLTESTQRPSPDACLRQFIAQGGIIP